MRSSLRLTAVRALTSALLALAVLSGCAAPTTSPVEEPAADPAEDETVGDYVDREALAYFCRELEWFVGDVQAQAYANDAELADDMQLLIEAAEGTGNDALTAEAKAAYDSFLQDDVDGAGFRLQTMAQVCANNDLP